MARTGRPLRGRRPQLRHLRTAPAALTACAVSLLTAVVLTPPPAHAATAPASGAGSRPTAGSSPRTTPGTAGGRAAGSSPGSTAGSPTGTAPGAAGGTPKGSTAGSPPGATGGSATDDMYVLRCLAPGQRARTVEAAVRLGLARAVAGHPERLAPVGSGAGGAGSAGTLTVQRWAEARPADFRRTCAALVAADAAAPRTADASGGGGGDGGWGDIVSGVLLAIAGAVFTLVIQFVDRGTARRRQRIDELAAATFGYARSASAFLDRWPDDPGTDHGEVRAARAGLAAALALLPGRAARRERAAWLADRLPLAEAPGTTRPNGASGVLKLSLAERADRARELRAALREILTGVEELGRTRPAVRARRGARTALRAPGDTTGTADAGGGER